MQVFERLESEVRSYCRAFPEVFQAAQGDHLIDRDGRRYVDFFAGAGALNYGHNNRRFKQKLLEYIENDGIVHSLDMATDAKETFLERFEKLVLKPRNLLYKIQFPGPTGTNAVEAALKLARKVTGRQEIVYFSGAFHGMTLGSLAVTSNHMKRKGAGVPLPNAACIPHEIDSENSLELLEEHLRGAGKNRTAAVILETVQGEGGVRAGSYEWLRGVAKAARRHGVLLIVDDIQVGCGRVGPFFSFEPVGIEPDMVCLSKSLSGFGLPMALLLLQPHLDLWQPGEHNGTFRGHNLAFITAAEALSFWEDDRLQREVERKSEQVGQHLDELASSYASAGAQVRGRGLIRGISFDDFEIAGKASREAFDRGLVIETAGPRDEVLKLLPPLTIADEILARGLEIIEESLATVLSGTSPSLAEPVQHVA